MNKPLLAKYNFAFIFLTLLHAFSFASANKLQTRTINIAGLVVDAKTLTPIDAATIYDGENNLLGTTDQNGYVILAISYAKPGPISFKLKVSKKGFLSFIQQENWADISGSTNSIMYFGLRKPMVKTEAFSKLLTSATDLSYENVAKAFSAVKQQHEFNEQLATAKLGNQNVFITLGDKYYLVDNTGWIELKSDKDLVTINDQETIAASKLNASVKRSSVKWMSPVEGKEVRFAVHTR